MLEDCANRVVNELREANRKANAYELGYKASCARVDKLQKACLRNYTRAEKWKAGALMTWVFIGVIGLMAWLIGRGTV